MLGAAEAVGIDAEEDPPVVRAARRGEVADQVDDVVDPGQTLRTHDVGEADIRAFAQGDGLVAPADVRIETRTFVIREETP